MIFFVLFSIVIIIGVFERFVLNIYQKRIPYRILVNGTRGKSSITRLITAALQQNGFKVLAKTSGTDTMLILPDGTENKVRRTGIATVAEQMTVIKYATRQKVQVLVIECMSLRPSLQQIESQVIIKPHITVISNVRPDHLDVSGSTLQEIASTFSQTIPRHGIVITAEQTFDYILQNIADLRNSQLKKITSSQNIDTTGFSYFEHEDNIEIAIAVCEQLGLNRNLVLPSFKNVIPDRGVLRRFTAYVEEKKINFVNAFAANDIVSTKIIFEKLNITCNYILVVNLRKERPHRTLDMLELLPGLSDAVFFVFIGDYVSVSNYLKNSGIDQNKVLYMFQKEKEEIIRLLGKIAQDETTLVGIGNIKGIGGELVDWFQKQSL